MRGDTRTSTYKRLYCPVRGFAGTRYHRTTILANLSASAGNSGAFGTVPVARRASGLVPCSSGYAMLACRSCQYPFKNSRAPARVLSFVMW